MHRSDMKSFVRAVRLLVLCALGALGVGCAETNAPLPEPVEVLLVVNQAPATLSIIPVDQPAAAIEVPLDAPAGTPTGVAARDSIAVVPLGGQDAVAVIDLHAGALLRTVSLPAGSGATGSAVVSDSVAYVANPGKNTVTAVNFWTGDTAEVAVGTTPQGVAFARGRVLVLNGNVTGTSGLEAGGTPPSWITVIDPATNARAAGIDSIPLTGPGNAKFADLGSDGLLYVVSVGTGASDGRLSIVDPVTRAELASFAGFGARPGNAATADDRVLVSSRTEGVMEFDSRLRTVTRGAGSGVRVPTNSAVAVDSRGRIYAVEAGLCEADSPGVAHVLDSGFVEIRTIPLGGCPVAATIVRVPQT